MMESTVSASPRNIEQKQSQGARDLLEDVFVSLLDLALDNGMTVLNLRDILVSSQIRALRQRGLTLRQIVLVSGLSRNTIRSILKGAERAEDQRLLAQFVENWSTSDVIPPKVYLSNSKYPCFEDVCERFGRGYSVDHLLSMLLAQGRVHIRGDHIELADSVERPEFVPTLSKIDMTGRYFEELEQLSSIHRRRGPDPNNRPVVRLAEDDADKELAARISLQALVATIRNNLDAESSPLIERRYWSRAVPDEKLPALRCAIQKLHKRHSEEVLNVICEYESREDADVDTNRTVGLGTYWFELSQLGAE